jgi:hypothetical protein
MGWLFEDPTTVIVAVALLEVLLGIALVNSGEVKVLWGMGAVLLLGVLLVLVELVVITDKEQISDTMSRAADALETNDAAAVMQYIAPEAGDMRSRAEAALSAFEVKSASFSGLDVTVNSHLSPVTAQARFFGKFNGRDRLGRLPYENVFRRFEVDLRREGERWVMTDYRMLGGPDSGLN